MHVLLSSEARGLHNCLRVHLHPYNVCIRVAKALARLSHIAGSSEPLLLAYDISTKLMCWLIFSYTH